MSTTAVRINEIRTSSEPPVFAQLTNSANQTLVATVVSSVLSLPTTSVSATSKRLTISPDTITIAGPGLYRIAARCQVLTAVTGGVHSIDIVLNGITVATHTSTITAASSVFTLQAEYIATLTSAFTTVKVNVTQPTLGSATIFGTTPSRASLSVFGIIPQ